MGKSCSMWLQLDKGPGGTTAAMLRHGMTLEPLHPPCTQQPCKWRLYVPPTMPKAVACTGTGLSSVITAFCLQELLWQGQAKRKSSKAETPLGSCCAASRQQQGPSSNTLEMGGLCHRETQAPSRVCCLVLPHTLLENSSFRMAESMETLPSIQPAAFAGKPSQRGQVPELHIPVTWHYIGALSSSSLHIYWPLVEGPWLDKP